jgi:hypothetical protein
MTPAFRLLCACCRWPDDDARRDAIRAAAAEVADWDEIPRLADRHRVEPLVAHGLAAADLPIPAALNAAVNHHRALSLRDIGETLRIAAALDEAGIVHRFLKGAPLGARAYANPLLKRSWDIDLLVLPGDAVRTAALLGTLEYAPHMPPRPLDTEEFKRWSVVSKEAEFNLPRGGTLELHWRVSDHPWLLATLSAETPARAVALLGERSVATLGDSENLAYLAVHGTIHAWSRLKWIADFNAFNRLLASGSREGLAKQARSYGVGDALDSALLLASRLFGENPATIAAPNRRAAKLVEISMRALALDDPRRIDRLASRARWTVVPGAAARLVEFAIRLRGSNDRLEYPLPPRWQFAYPLLRLPLFALRLIFGRTG